MSFDQRVLVSVLWLHQLDPVPKWVIDVEPVIALKWLVADNTITASLQMRCKRTKIIHYEGGMGFPSRDELRFNAQMDFQATLLEPASASRRKVNRFSHFAHPKHALVKCPRVILSADGHRELDVIEVKDLHFYVC